MANTLSSAERAAGWRLLFDGTTADQWRGDKRADLPAGWTVSNDMLFKERLVEDIITKEQFSEAPQWRGASR